MQTLAAKVPGLGAISVVVAGWLFVGHSDLRADVITGTSSAYGLSVNLSLDVLPLINGGIDVNAGIGPLPSNFSNSAPATYNTTSSVINLNAGASGSIPLVLTSLVNASNGTFQGTIASNVNGTPGAKSASGSSNVNGLTLSVADLPILADLLGLSATVSSSAAVNGDGGSLVGSGSSNIQNLSLNVSGVNVLALANVSNVAPNTVAALSTPVAGLTVTLNEQINTFTTPGNDEMRNFVVNAVHVRLNALNLAGIGSITGDIIIAQSQASLLATPEPSSMILLGLGLGGMVGGAILRKRRQSQVVKPEATDPPQAV